MNKKLILDSVDIILKQQSFNTTQKQNIQKSLTQSRYSRLNYKDDIDFKVGNYLLIIPNKMKFKSKF
jgi:hypothetical protein